MAAGTLPIRSGNRPVEMARDGGVFVVVAESSLY